MVQTKEIFLNKKILIYGLGKTGFSSFLYLKKNNKVYLYDDNQKNIISKKFKDFLIKNKNINKFFFDFIIISPGINIQKCNLKNFLKKNSSKIITDLDIFCQSFPNHKKIAITGTNGKSTTAKILFEILKDQKKDVRLVGNIGNPILSEKKIRNNTIFVIEISSYQIEYSKKFKANYSILLNISPDHLERHKTFKNYVNSKFKLVKNQTSKDYFFLNNSDKFINKELKKRKILSKVIKVNFNLFKKYKKKIKNPYFSTLGNQQNLSFIFAIAHKLILNKTKFIKTINNFKGLKYRQEIIHKSKNLTIINDSKATSFSSSVNILRTLKNVFWIVGGIPKQGDKFLLSKKNSTHIRAYLFGKNKKHFLNQLKKKINIQTFKNLKVAINKVIKDIKLENNNYHNTILFSPSAASFDTFKNFEDRGKKFNSIIKKTNDIW